MRVFNGDVKYPHSIIDAEIIFSYSDADDFMNNLVTAMFSGRVVKLPRILKKHSQTVWKKDKILTNYVEQNKELV